MNWEAIGAVGDFVSGIAVLVTLGYLLVQTRQINEQLRQSIETLRLAVFDTNQQAGERSRELFISNPDAAELLERGVRDLGLVKREERFRFDLLIQHLFLAIQASYIRFVVRGVDPVAFEEMTHVLDRLLRGEGARAWWARRSGDFGAEFRSYVTDRLGQRAG